MMDQGERTPLLIHFLLHMFAMAATEAYQDKTQEKPRMTDSPCVALPIRSAVRT